MEIFSIDTFQY